MTQVEKSCAALGFSKAGRGVRMTDSEKFISTLEIDKVEIVLALRKISRNISTNITEGIKWNALCFFKVDRAFVGIMPYKKYVSVIFDHGSEMTDEFGVLEGSGKQMRHIKIHAFGDITKKKVAQYIRNSYSMQEGD
jgi:hypothetical protein